MPGDVNWTKGFKNEYGLIEDRLNSATAGELDTFTDLIWNTDMGLMDAHTRAFFGGQVHEKLSSVSDTWFGGGSPSRPMWLWDCTLTLGQMHQVMRESRARTCALMKAMRQAGYETEKLVRIWLQCAHPRMRTVITWPGAQPEDAENWDTPWEPKMATGPVRVWVFVPYNAGYGYYPTPEQRAAAAELKSRLDAEVGANGKPQDVMTYEHLDVINDGTPAGELVWRGTNLATRSDPTLGDRAGLQVRFIPRVQEPPLSPYARDPELPVLVGAPRPGIEITWGGAPDGVLTNSQHVVVDAPG